MSTCGFCGEKLEPLVSHISPSQCITAYKERIERFEKLIAALKTELSKITHAEECKCLQCRSKDKEGGER